MQEYQTFPYAKEAIDNNIIMFFFSHIMQLLSFDEVNVSIYWLEKSDIHWALKTVIVLFYILNKKRIQCLRFNIYWR